MNSYPCLNVDCAIIYRNACLLRRLCLNHHIEPLAVIKGYNGLSPINSALFAAGFRQFASSRLAHLAAIKQQYPLAATFALRLPMLSEIAQVIAFADYSFNSEEAVLAALNQEAAACNKTHKIILMRDLGDLREGVFTTEALLKLALKIEFEFEHLHLAGIASNLTCYGSIIPDTTNLGQLAADAANIEAAIGRKLEIISGGSTSSLPLVYSDSMPAAINQLRLGESLIVPCDLIDYWQVDLPGLSNAGLILQAQIIELNTKPTMPIGQIGVDGLGIAQEYQDKGLRKRALLALGVFDVGDIDKLICLDKGSYILGASSDHLIVDIEDSKIDYQLGDIINFQLHYKAMLFTTANPLMNIKYINEY